MVWTLKVAEEDGSSKRQSATFKKKADFTKKADVAKFGCKNPLKQGVILFFILGGFICIALMEIYL